MIMSINQKIREVKQINIKNRTYYFYNDLISYRNFESNFLKTDKKSYKKHSYLQHWLHNN